MCVGGVCDVFKPSVMMTDVCDIYWRGILLQEEGEGLYLENVTDGRSCNCVQPYYPANF